MTTPVTKELYKQLRAAMMSRDDAASIGILKRIIAADPGDEAARKQLSTLWLSAQLFRDGGYVSLPPSCTDEEALQLLRVAMQLRNDHGWGLGFPTACEETLSSKEYSNVTREIGVDPKDGQMLVARFGQYGPYVQKGDGDSRQYASLAPGQLIESITLEEALKLFELPRTVGQLNGIDIICTKGRFGPYIKYGDKNVSMPRGTDPLKIDIDSCIKLIEDSMNKTSGGIIAEYKDSDIQVIDGNYGPYIKHAGSNYKIPKGTDPSVLTEDKCKEIIASTEPTGRKKRRK